MTEIGIFDWILWLLYFVLIFLAMFLYKNGKKDTELYRYFMPAFLIKVFGGVAFMLVYIYYYGFGDTFLYHNGANVLVDSAVENPFEYIRLLLSGHGNLPPDLQEYAVKIPYSRTKEEWFMVKLISPINMVGLKSYLLTTLLFSILSFYGSWKLFTVAVDLVPKRKVVAFLLIFVLPSTLFWGSGILKDTISMAAINILIYTTYSIFFKGEGFKSKYILLTLIAVVLLANIKLYILLAFLPGLALGLFAHFKNQINAVLVRYVLAPITLGIMVAAGYFIVLNLGEMNSKYAVDSLEQQARGFHTWHTTTAGSAYNLGEVEYSASGVVQKIPASLVVTFFRPYLWESRNAIMLIGALESLVLLSLTLYLVARQRFKLIKSIRRHPFMVMISIFILIFGFAIGFTSYNFGALARYKIPILSLTFFVVLYLVEARKVSVQTDS